jgi:hypothetical protein
MPSEPLGATQGWSARSPRGARDDIAESVRKFEEFPKTYVSPILLYAILSGILTVGFVGAFADIAAHRPAIRVVPLLKRHLRQILAEISVRTRRVLMLYHSQATERIVRDGDLDTGFQGVSDPFTLSNKAGKLQPVC